jgi:hypothetical protein
MTLLNRSLFGMKVIVKITPGALKAYVLITAK